MQDLEMVHLVSCTSQFEARLLAARLGAEGIVWQLRGESSVYPVGGAEVLVEAADLARARDVLRVAPLEIEDEIESEPDGPDETDEGRSPPPPAAPAARRRGLWRRWLGAGIVLVGFGERLLDPLLR